MKTTVSLYDFREAFRLADRMGNFSYEGLEVLFDYLELLEADTDQEFELDVIALCCEYAEDTFANIADNYNIDLSDVDRTADTEEQMDEVKAIVLDYLNDNTMVVGEVVDDRVVYQVF